MKIAWPLYRTYGHAFEAMKTMVADDGAGVFAKLEEVSGGPVDVLTPEVGCSAGCWVGRERGCRRHAQQEPRSWVPRGCWRAVPVLAPVGLQVREALLKNIKRRMTPQPVKVRADVELTCFQYDGVEHIKVAMRAAQAQSTEVRTLSWRRLWGGHPRDGCFTVTQQQQR